MELKGLDDQPLDRLIGMHETNRGVIRNLSEKDHSLMTIVRGKVVSFINGITRKFSPGVVNYLGAFEVGLSEGEDGGKKVVVTGVENGQVLLSSGGGSSISDILKRSGYDVDVYADSASFDLTFSLEDIGMIESDVAEIGMSDEDFAVRSGEVIAS